MWREKKQLLKTLLLGLFLIVWMGTPVSVLAMAEVRSENPSVKSQVAKILLSGLGGAVLGISTLSFYDRPQDHLSNVAVGGVLGIIAGSVYVTKESLEQEEPSLVNWKQGGIWDARVNPKNQSYQITWAASF